MLRIFFRHFAPDREKPADGPSPAAEAAQAEPENGHLHRDEMRRIVDVMCDEEALNKNL